MKTEQLRDLSTYQAAAVRYAKDCPDGRNPGAHLTIVWMNFRDVFIDHRHFFNCVAGSFPESDMELLARDLLECCR